MPFRIKVSLVILGLILALVVVLPLVLPIPPLEGTRPVDALAGPDGRFVEAAGVRLHVEVAGPSADEADAGAPAFVLLHGFASGTFTWHAVMDELGARGPVVAFDRPGFGLTERPLPGSWARGHDPYTLASQVDQTIALMDALGLRRAVLIGHSSGALVALETAALHPDRVSGLVLADAAVYRQGGPPAWARWLLATPQAARIGPVLMRQFAGDTATTLLRNAWADPSRLDDATLAAYAKPLQADHWDEGLWQVTRASRPFRLQPALVRAPVLVVTGAEDKIVPPEDDDRLAAALGAPVERLADCGHVPQEECPRAFLDTVEAWVDRNTLGVARPPVPPSSTRAGR